MSPPWKFLACPLVALLPMISRLATSSFSQRSKLCSSSCRGITTILKCICYSFSQDKTKECQQPAGQLHPKISQPWTAHCTSSQLYIVLLAVTNDNVCAKSLQVGQLLCHFVQLVLTWHNWLVFLVLFSTWIVQQLNCLWKHLTVKEWGL